MFLGLNSRKGVSHMSGIMVNLVSSGWKCGFPELVSQGRKFTRCNNQYGEHRIWETLDYTLITPTWTLSFKESSVNLEQIASNHAPLLNSEDRIFKGRKIFRFEDLWIQEESFGEKIYEAHNYSANQPFISRLKRVKNSILEWNSNHIGNLEEKEIS